jgi:hypothetical protein
VRLRAGVGGGRCDRGNAAYQAGNLTGAAFAVTGQRPLEAILLAQAANGMLLPIIAGFLLWVAIYRLF